jgi:broad specificity phosphatase PhoE
LTPQNAGKVLGMPVVQQPIVHVADKLVGSPVVTALPSPIKMDTAEAKNLENTGTQPSRIDNDSVADNVTFPGNQLTWACQNCGGVMNGSQLKYNSPDMVTCPICAWMTKASSGRVMVPCSNCNKSFEDMGECASVSMRKNWNDYGVVAGPADGLVPTDLAKREAKCPECKAIVNRANGKTLYPPQIVDWNLRCPGCSANNWKILTNSPETAMCQCMSCAKKYDVKFNNEKENPLMKKVNFAYFGATPCVQCGHNIQFSSSSAITTKNLKCPKCELTFAYDIRRESQKRQVQKVSAVLEDNMTLNQSSKQEPGALYLVRHAHTKDEGKVHGWMNMPLDKKGKQEAKELGSHFRGTKIDKVYTSDMSRAYDTAHEISKQTDAPITTKFDLRSWNLGEHQGTDGDKTRSTIQDSMSKTPNTKVKGGESFNNFKARCLNMARKLLEEAKQKKVVAVTHTRAIKLINAWIKAGCPDDNSFDENEFKNDTIDNGSIRKYEPTDKNVIVTKPENLQKASTDNTTISSEKGDNQMSEEQKTVVPAVEVPVAEETVEIEDADIVEQEDEGMEVAKTLSTEARKGLKDSDFAVVKTVKDKKSGSTKTIRKYPIHDEAHVRNALSRLGQKPSQEGLKKLGVSIEGVKAKVHAKAKAMGIETADYDEPNMNPTGVVAKNAVAGPDMQKAEPRHNEGTPTVASKAGEGTGNTKKDKANKDNNHVAGLTPDQINQMQNQLFSNVKKAMRFQKYMKASRKNIKALKKAMQEGVFASVEDVDIKEVAENLAITPKEGALSTDRGTGEDPKKSVTIGQEANTAAPKEGASDTAVNLDANKTANELAKNLTAGDKDGDTVPVIAPETPVVNEQETKDGTTKVDTTSDGKVDNGVKGTGESTKVVAVEVVPPIVPVETLKTANEEVPSKGAETVVNTVSDGKVDNGDKGTGSDTTVKVAAPAPVVSPALEVKNDDVTSKGAVTPVSTVSDGKVDNGVKGIGSAIDVPGTDKNISAASTNVGEHEIGVGEKPEDAVVTASADLETAALKNENESLKAKIQALEDAKMLLETAAVKILERKNTLGEYGKNLSDKDILDDEKFEVAKLKKDNAELRIKLNTSNSRVADINSVSGDDVADLRDEITNKAFGLKSKSKK